MFDPWTATVDEALQAHSEKTTDSDPCDPIFQYDAVCKINALRVSVEAGDGFSVLQCVSLTLMHGLVAPDWLVKAFLPRYRAVLHCNAKSWDDPLSFGRPYPKGFNLAAHRKARRGRFQVRHEVKSRLANNPNQPIDKSLFAEVGSKFGYGATLAEEYYYQAEKMLGSYLQQTNGKRTKRKMPRNPANS